MTKLQSTLKTFLIMALMGLTLNGFSQINNWRAYDQDGINVFEAPQDNDAEFNGTKVRIGGAFAQQWQSLSHSNDTSMAAGMGVELYDLAPGFNLATANLNVDVQLNDGIRLALESYMSARHHTEFWVKGGYIQIDKLPMFDNPEWFTNSMRVKVGHFQPNFGDQQFRRSDNGNAMYNPFVGNYIMDAFATEIGTEIYVFPAEGILAMFGITNGLIKGDVATPAEGKKRSPSIYLKGAFDRELNEDLRVRLSASMVMNSSTIRNTMYSGDRAGSRFYGPMEEAGASLGSKFKSGRWSPGFNNQLTSIQINPFVKFKGLEIFGVIESASGNVYSKDANDEFELNDDNKRSVMQIGGEVIYRLLEDESLYVGGKFNKVSGQLSSSFVDANGDFEEASIQRIEAGAGWFATKNLLLKLNFVQQSYTDFPETNVYYGGEFSGITIEAVAAF
jgi:hypothetical protein